MVAEALAAAAGVRAGAPRAAAGAPGRLGPQGVSVRNTFIDFRPEGCSPSERFLEARRCRSSPASRALSRQVSGREEDDPFAIATPTGSALPTPRGCYGARQMPRLSGELRDQAPTPVAPVVPAAPQVLRLSLSQLVSEPEPRAAEGAAATAAAAAARLLQELQRGTGLVPSSVKRGEVGSALCSTTASSMPGSAIVGTRPFQSFGSAASSALSSGLVPGAAELPAGAASVEELACAKVGSPEVPSRGSALHAWGACKPCAFVFQDGCAHGTDCEFCHLCEPGERKRRKKERRRLALSSAKHVGGHPVGLPR